MENALSEFLKLLFQPPVLILFCMAIVGLSMMASDRSEYRFRVNTEWRVRASFYKHLGFNDDLIARARVRFYKQHHLKAPKQNT